MKSHIHSIITLFSLTFALFIITPDYVSSQASGCDPIFTPLIYNQEPISDTIDGQFWAFSYCFNGNAGDVVNISMIAISDDLDTYLELQDSNKIKLIDNDDIDKTSSDSLIQYTLPTTGAYYISASRYDGVSGKTYGGFSLTLSSSNDATRQGRPTSSTTDNTATPTDVCYNVALEMDFVGEAFNTAYTENPLALLDDNPNTGWASDSAEQELWFDVVLDGMQTVTYIEFNGYAFSSNPAKPENSINRFRLSYWDPSKLNADGENGDFETIFDEVALMQPGYQTYTFDNPVTVASLTFILVDNHDDDGSILEVADIKVCTDTNNTAGRQTTNTTNQTVAPATVAILCTITAPNNNTLSRNPDLPDGATVRVGPDNANGQRTPVVFLNKGGTYKVDGQALDVNGNVWWLLDKYEVAPKKAAQVNDTWVKADDVTTNGDCDVVETVNPARVVRIRPAAPTRPTSSNPSNGNSSDGNSSGENSSDENSSAPPEGSSDQFISFYADPGYLFEGECTTLNWLVQNVREVYFIDYNGSESRLTDPTGQGQVTVCPTVPTGKISLLTYALRVVPLSGADVYKYAEVEVDANFIEIIPCIPSLPFLSNGGTLDDRSVETYSMFVEPCGDNAVAIEVYVGVASGDMDPYIYVNDTNGTYYGEDNDSGGGFDALLNFCVFEASTIQIEVSNAFLDGTGEYYIQVTTQEQFCG